MMSFEGVEKMETDKLYTKSNICQSCLVHDEGQVMQIKSLKHEPLVALFQDHDLALCYICKKDAEHFESFFESVSHVQRLLQGADVFESSFLDTARGQVIPTKALTKQTLQSIDIGLEFDQNASLEEGNYVVYSCFPEVRDVNVKLEVEQESQSNDLDDGFLDEDDLPLSYHSITPDLKHLVKQEIDADELDIYALKTRKYTKGKTKMKRMYLPDYYEKISITLEECLREREQLAQSDKFLKLPHKCMDCIKGFQHKGYYITHMEAHHKSKGKFVCDICKVRHGTYKRLKQHKDFHLVRHRCRMCGETSKQLRSIYDHYMVVHSGKRLFPCSVCYKHFKRPSSLRAHMYSVHRGTRVTCDHCQKSYRHIRYLRRHMIATHLRVPKERSPRVPQSHACPECGKEFRKPSLLKVHMGKHSKRKDFYCVECDKSYKSKITLGQHLKTGAHVTVSDFHHPCLLCDKRFRIRRCLDMHMNSTHLKVKPHQCDQCDRSYLSKWSLKEHKRLAHEGYKRPYAYPCPMCDKVFNRNDARTRHLRTHTGERPYACTHCPASFAQGSDMHTHVKRVHLQLTRDGKAKRKRRLDKKAEIDVVQAKRLRRRTSKKSEIDVVQAKSCLD